MQVYLEMFTQFGIVGGAFIFLLWQSAKREAVLMKFVNDTTIELGRMSHSLTMLNEDLRDVRRKLNIVEKATVSDIMQNEVNDDEYVSQGE